MLTELMTFSSPENSVAMLVALSAATASSAEPDRTSRPFADFTSMSAPGNRVADRARQLVGVERHLDVDAADQLLVLVEQRDAGGAEIVAEHIEGFVGERIDVGDLGIADDDLVERAHWS